MGVARILAGLWLLVLLGAGCHSPEATDQAPPLLFPALGADQDKLHTLTLRGAGGVELVRLSRKDGAWRVAQRDGWPADEGRISQTLFLLSQVRGSEAKTSNPSLYAKLGVEPVSLANAGGVELNLQGAGIEHRLLIGREHPRFDSHYVRVDGQAQSWLTDLPVAFDRNPAVWLDRRLVDLPLPRVARVRVGGDEVFSLGHRDDRFRVDGVPSAAMRDSYQGDALAGALDQLRFEDVAKDDPAARAVRTLEFTALDGAVLELQLIRVGDAAWLRGRARLDAAQAAEWARTKPDARGAREVRERVATWQRRLEGRRFLLPAAVAARLALTRDEILAGVPSA